MRVVLFYDQTQAGAGGKERPDVELSVEKGGIGSYTMFEKYMKENDGTVLATIFVGNGYFFKHEEEVKIKVKKLLDKVKADILLCGPCFNYHDYSLMSAKLSKYIDSNSQCKSLVVCSKENSDVIDEYKDDIIIVEMPKKGGIGLSSSLENMCKVAAAINSGTFDKSKDTSVYK